MATPGEMVEEDGVAPSPIDGTPAEDASSPDASETAEDTFDALIESLDGSPDEVDQVDDDDGGEEEGKTPDAEPSAKEEPKPEGDAPKVEDPENAEPETAEKKSNRIPDDVFDKLPDVAKARIKDLSADNNRHVAKIQSLTKERDTFQRGYEITDRIETFMKDNSLTSNDFDIGMKIMAHLGTGDHQKFLDLTLPYVHASQEILGARIAPEFQQLVDAGDMTEEAARLATKHKASDEYTKAVTAQRDQQRTAQQHLDQTEREAQERTDALRGKAAALEVELSQSDPLWHQKKDVLHQRMANWLKQINDVGGMPRMTAEMFEGQVRQIYEGIHVTPPKKPTLPTPAAQPSTRKSTPAPAKTANDALARGLEMLDQ